MSSVVTDRDVGNSSSGSVPGRQAAIDRRTANPHGAWLGALLGAGVIVLLGSAMLFTSRGFATDFTNTLWLGSVQQDSVLHGTIPSFFSNTTAAAPLAHGYYYPYPRSGLFNPIFAFYSGPLLAALGCVSVLCFDNVIAAFIVLTLLAIGAAYLGIYWLARRTGCIRLIAHGAALTFVASAYYITDLYGRGDWPEFVAVSSIPLLVACAVDLLSAPAIRIRSLLGLYVVAVVFTGSHDVTMVWGTLYIVLLAIAVLLARVAHWPTWSRICAVVVVGALAVGTNGWAIVPALLYSGHTFIATGESVIGTPFVDTFEHLFNPLRSVPAQSTSPGLYVQVPVWMLGWAFFGGLCYCVARPRNKTDRRLFLLLIAAAGIWLTAMMNRQFWNYLPHVLWTIQNPFVLSTYFSLSIAALVIAVGASASLAESLGRPGRSMLFRVPILALLACSAVTLGLAGWQILVPNDGAPVMSYANRSDALVGPHTLPASWYARLDYSDVDMPVATVQDGRTVTLTASLVNPHGDGLNAVIAAPAGSAPIATNVVAAPDFTSIGGDFTTVGRTSSGYLVLSRKTSTSGPARLIIASSATIGLRAGRLVTFVSVGMSLCLVLLLAAGHFLRIRKRSGSASASSETAASSH